jgi:subtilisin-like proprotein convertase family protein
MTAGYTASFSIINAVYYASMDANPGWIFDANSAWAWGQPTGGGLQNRDPVSGHTGGNVVGYNLNGNYSRNILYYATTPAIDCSHFQDLTLSFWRWLGVNSSATASVQASADDGVTWTTLWTNGGQVVSDDTWVQQQFTLPAAFNGQSTVRIRWAMGPTGNSRATYPGWNIDDVLMAGSPITISGKMFLDANGNGAADTGEGGIPNATVLLDLNGNGVADPGGTLAFAAGNVPLAIPDNDPNGVASTLTVTATGLISSVALTFDITHTFDSDLTGYLIGPDGTQITVFNRVGGSGQNFVDTTLVDSASSSVATGAAPFAGSFQPSPDALAIFTGKVAAGVWTFRVADGVGQDTGTLNSWSLQITTTPEPVTTTNVDGTYSFNVSPGSYTVLAELPAHFAAVAAPTHAVHVTTSATDLDFPVFPTQFSSSADSYYLSLDATGTTLLIAPDGMAAPVFQIALSLLPSLTFNLTGANQIFTVDFTHGTPAPAAGITLNAVRGHGTTLTLAGQSNAQSVDLTDYQFGPAATPGLISYNSVDNLTLSNITAHYSGVFSSILNLTITDNSLLYWG